MAGISGVITAGTVIAGVVVKAGVPGTSLVHFDHGPHQFTVQQPGTAGATTAGTTYSGVMVTAGTPGTIVPEPEKLALYS